MRSTATRGRLWAICGSCHRWNLTPIEDRWEALEELEKTTRDSSRLLSQTDNISLLKSGELEIVRVGQAKLTEEAWWRYGREMRRRRKLSFILQGLDVAMIGLIAAATGGAVIAAGFGEGGFITPLVKLHKFGRTAWQGEVLCIRCGKPLNRVRFSKVGKAKLIPGGEDDPLPWQCQVLLLWTLGAVTRSKAWPRSTCCGACSRTSISRALRRSACARPRR